MHDDQTLSEVLKGLAGKPYSGVLTRYVDLEDFSTAPVKRLFYDQGPHRHGQRYSPKGGPKGLYAGEGVTCALAEATQKGLSALKPKRAATRIQLDFNVKLRSVLDLGEATVRKALGTTLDELKDVWQGVYELSGHWPATWRLGQAVFDCERFEGIRFPSKQANRKYCLLVLTERLAPGSHVIAKGKRGDLERIDGGFPLK